MKKYKEILNSIIKDKPLKPGSYRGRKNTAPEKKQFKWRKSMLKQENKIFKNLYNDQGWEIDNALKRDDWKEY